MGGAFTFQRRGDTCMSARACGFRHALIVACFLVGLALQAIYYKETVVKEVVLSAHTRELDMCVDFELFRAETGYVYTEGELTSNETRCYSTTFYDLPRLKRTRRTQSRTHKRDENQLNVFILVLESLGFHKFLDQMPLTRSVLDEFGVAWLKGLHRREGGTRENLPPLFFGEPLTYTLDINDGNYSASFNLSKSTLENNAIWRIAQREGYQTLYGSTACNLLFGLHHVSTNDGFVWHDTIGRYNDFTDSFPYGAYYTPSDIDGECRFYREVRTAKDILRCSESGPYHHKFFEYYKLFSSRTSVPLFTVTQLLEPHGNYLYWPLDFHISEFLRWLLNKQDTILVFLGDHAERGDPLTTPAAVVLPWIHKQERDKLRRLSSAMLLMDDFYPFLQEYFQKKNVDSAVDSFERAMKKNTCADHPDLANCYCKSQLSKVPVFNEHLVKRAVEYVQEQSKDVEVCETLNLQQYRNVQMTASYVSFELVFTKGIIFELRFTTTAAVTMKQLSRYASQIPCTPSGISPEFCLCNATSFREHNSRASLGTTSTL